MVTAKKTSLKTAVKKSTNAKSAKAKTTSAKSATVKAASAKRVATKRPTVKKAQTAKPVNAPPVKLEKSTEVKAKKTKLIRDSFTMPKGEYQVIDELKARAAKLGHPVKKSELLRAAIKQIAGLSDAALIAAMSAVPPIKTGRPRKD